MKYDSQLYDLPVVDRLSGELVGYMRGVICEPGNRKIEGIVYEEIGWLHRYHTIPWNAIAVIGDKSIIIDKSKKSRAARNTICAGKDNKVFNTDGSYAGKVSNYLIDEKSGSVMGMELSASVVDDLKFGRKIIENRGNIMKGEDFLLLVNSDEPTIIEQNERRSDDEGLF